MRRAGTIRKVIRKRIIPPQAPAVAAHFRSAANKIYDLAAQIESVARQLEPTWEGNSKNRFFADFAPTPNQVKNSADTLSRLAAEVEHIIVEIEIIANV